MRMANAIYRRDESRVWYPCRPSDRIEASFLKPKILTLVSLRLGVRSFFTPWRESWVIRARARFERPELRLVLSLPAAVLLLERLQRFLRRRDDGAVQRL